MKYIKNILFSVFVIVFFFYGCETPNNKNTELNMDTENFDSSAVQISSEIEDEQKTVDWSDGNTYSYDYTEEISSIDSLGNEEILTIYKRNKPSGSDINCDAKECKWCGNSIYATDFSIEEYPDLSFLRGEADALSLLGTMMSVFDGKSYYDFPNKRFRTEWRVNCVYPSPTGFCSEKCKYEFEHRDY